MEEMKKEHHSEREHHDEKVHDENCHEYAAHSQSTEPNTRLWIMAIALILLIVVSGVQAVELLSIKNQLGSNTGTAQVAQPSPSGSGNSGALAKNLQNLPKMVGGC